MATRVGKVGRVLRVSALAALVAAAGVAAAWVAYSNAAAAGPAAAAKPEAKPDAGERVRRVGVDGLEVPPAVAAKLGLKSVAAAAPSAPVALPPFQGKLNVDSNTLQHVHSRFAGTVASLGTVGNAEPVNPGSQAAPQTLSYGDRVEKGQLLAVVQSRELGEKKSELVDALSKLATDTLTLKRREEAEQIGGTAALLADAARRDVQADRVAVERAERTLRSWQLTDAEVAAVYAEAGRLSDPKRADRQADAVAWARAEVRAAAAGTIVMKNVVVGDPVDTTADLFQIGDLSHLAVWADIYEEDLPRFAALALPARATLTLPSRPGVSQDATIQRVGSVIDPNQHTALLLGRVNNPAGQLKAGQFVTLTVEAPPTPGEVAVPAEAVLEDGRESVVFVADPANPNRLTLRPVTVARRGRDAVTLTAGVKPGERVITTGALLLREAMDTLVAGGK